MSRPVLVLDQLSRAGAMQKRREVGRVFGAMAAPRLVYAKTWDGIVPALAPRVQDLGEVRNGAISFATYFDRYLVRLGDALPVGPGELLAVAAAPFLRFNNRVRVDGPRDGDALVCSCATPWSARRRHPCHLEFLAPVLVQAGWDVRLYDGLLTLDGDVVVSVHPVDEGVRRPYEAPRL
jgi:hypothetical protein